MYNAKELKEKTALIEKKLSKEFEDISTFIYEHPELGLEEYESSAYLINYLKDKGFTVTTPYAGFETGFRAEYGTKGPAIAYLAEYDALPGYGPDKVNGHACGHNFIAATCLGAGAVLRELANELEMRVIVIGTPAEETYGSKVAMVERGVFDDIDIALQSHLAEDTANNYIALAMNDMIVTYTGKAAHSAAAPWDGINALDAVQLFYSGVNALRQHVKPDVRIHGIVTEGGKAPNVVPDKASCSFYIRSTSRAYLNTLLPKIENIAQGAALMTGAELEIKHDELPFDDLINLPTLQKLAEENYTANDLPPTLTPERAIEIAGSTDIGNVSHAIPTMYVEVAIPGDEKVMVHEESALKLVDSPAAHIALHNTVKALAGMAIDLVCDPALIAQAKKELADIKK